MVVTVVGGGGQWRYGDIFRQFLTSSGSFLQKELGRFSPKEIINAALKKVLEKS